MRKPFLVTAIVLASAFCIHLVYAGTLSCTVTTSCPTGVTVFKMANTTNSHAELYTQSNYTQLVCCTGVLNLANSCSGIFGSHAVKILKLSGTTNAHVEEGTLTNYANNACLWVSSGGSISVGYQNTNCAGYDTTVASISGTTNAHVADSSVYPLKVCASAFVPVISVSVSDGVISYGTVAAGASQDTTATGLNDTQTVTNDGNVTETFSIKGVDTGCPWTLAAAAAANQYVHSFSTNAGSSWTALTTTYQTMASGISPAGTQALDLMLTTPTTSSCLTSQSADITILAS